LLLKSNEEHCIVGSFQKRFAEMSFNLKSSLFLSSLADNFTRFSGYLYEKNLFHTVPVPE